MLRTVTAIVNVKLSEAGKRKKYTNHDDYTLKTTGNQKEQYDHLNCMFKAVLTRVYLLHLA